MFYFKVEQALPRNTDVYPPNRVTDLRVVAMQIDEMILTIEWTAPGDDLDIGKGKFKRHIHSLISLKRKIVFYLAQYPLIKSSIRL